MRTSLVGIALSVVSLGLPLAACTAAQVATGAGDACTPSVEKDPAFRGFDEQEVTVETGSSQCALGTCLVNHFRGRVTSGAQMTAQCTDRLAKDAVYCSCRCSNIEGKTDDGAEYCACPSGFTCSQLVTSIGEKNDITSGAYCIKAGTEYHAESACAETVSN